MQVRVRKQKGQIRIIDSNREELCVGDAVEVAIWLAERSVPRSQVKKALDPKLVDTIVDLPEDD